MTKSQQLVIDCARAVIAAPVVEITAEGDLEPTVEMLSALLHLEMAVKLFDAEASATPAAQPLPEKKQPMHDRDQAGADKWGWNPMPDKPEPPKPEGPKELGEVAGRNIRKGFER